MKTRSLFAIRSTSRNQRGVAIVFVAFLLLLFGTGVALAIDLALYMSALTRAQTISDQISLASLERQLTKTGDDDSPDKRLETALDEAVHFSELNAVLGEVVAKGESYIDLFSGSTSPGRARLIPGRYVYNDVDHQKAQQDGANDCDGGTNYPKFCGFRHFAGKTHDELAINSMRVVGELHSPLFDRFSGLLGYETFPIRVESTAFREPVELMLVVDRSGSMAEESFLRLDDSSVPQIRASLPNLLLGEFCFGSSPASRLSTDPCTFESNPGSINPHEVFWRKLTASGINRPKEHFRDDYATDSTGAYVDTEWSNLDEYHASAQNYTSLGYEGPLLYRRVSGNYEGPKPFLNMLLGLYSLLEELRDGNMAGNRLGLVFFGGNDNAVPIPFANAFGWTHVLHSLPTDRLCYIENLLCSGDPGCAGANPKCPPGQSILNRGIDTTIQEKLDRLGLFPTFALNTDAYFGLAQAFIEVERTRTLGIRTNRQLVMISGDGLSNCKHTDANNVNCFRWQRLDYNGNGRVDQGDRNACIACEPMFQGPECQFFANMGEFKIGRTGMCNLVYSNSMHCPRISNGEEAIDLSVSDCMNRLSYHEQSMAEIKTYAQFLQRQGVTLNAILSSETVGVNVLDIGGDNDKCLSQEEAHARHQWYTSNYTEGCERRGMFGEDPVLCQQAYHNRSKEKPFRRVLREWEEAAAMTGGKLYQILPAPVDCSPRTTCASGTVTRRDTDPECRTTEQQWNDIMSELMRSSRYVLAPRNFNH